ncbi:Druantia anti-phage system protein DruA [Mesorhizobium sp. 128a]
MRKGVLVKFPSPEAQLKRAVRQDLKRLGFKKSKSGQLLSPGQDKEAVRLVHAEQRGDKLKANAAFLARYETKLLPHFADGNEIEPSNIRLALRRVRSGTKDADLFRLATLTWSVPVSAGFGRRLRYLVWDESHNRLAGVIALGDPVFNLSVRDKLVGWNSADRSLRLVHLLDAYVLGAVPPYSFLLGGKAVAALVRTREVVQDFKDTYGESVGIISGAAKHASLLMVTTTSSMGRSSVYNRLALDGTRYFQPVGYTTGWGHFHITDALFEKLRAYLRQLKHDYADHHAYGKGPNWRLRTIKAALTRLGFKDSLLKHGIQRQVFLCNLAGNTVDILQGSGADPDYSDLLSVAEVSALAVARWMAPRGMREPAFRHWRRNTVPLLVRGTIAGSLDELRNQAA